MNTLRFSISAEAAMLNPGGGLIPGSSPLAQPAQILRQGGTVAFATETVYGLGADAFNAGAVAKIFTAKQRPAWDPLIVHIADETMLLEVARSIPPAARALIDAFWPGPLTLLLPRHPRLPASVTAGRDSVGVRMPAHPVALALIRTAGVAIAAPSANTFGHVSPTTAAHVAADLDGRIDAILDSGNTLHGLESSVVDTCVTPALLYRPGALTLEQLRQVWPAIEPYAGHGQAEPPQVLPSPGLAMRHYAPRARLVLVEDEPLGQQVVAKLVQAQEHGERAGLMLAAGIGYDEAQVAEAASIFQWGSWHQPAVLAQRLFAGLRALDDEGVQVIVCPLPQAQGIGVAIIDRLRKAAHRT